MSGRGRWVLLGVLVVVVAVALALLAREARWRGPLYCIERAGQLWGGQAGALPPGFSPQCPATASYRAEVRRGETRVEQYTAAGWQPRALLGALRGAGWTQLSDEPVSARTYVAFLERGGVQIQYLADRTGAGTLITLSGRP